MKMAYEHEAAERISDNESPVIVQLSDCEETTAKEHVLSETGYRRGFMQGMFRAIEAIKNGVGIGRMEDFLYSEIFDWRYSRHNGEWQQPPEVTK